MSDLGYKIVALLPKLRGFARALTRSHDAADDLVQATCEKALRHRQSWTPGTKLDSWLFRIMRNHWIDTLRRNRPEVSIDRTEMAEVLPSEDGRRTAEARLTLADVRAIANGLPDEQRMVLMLVCVEDMSYRETAELLDVPIGTVMSRLARARATLMAAMEDGGVRPKASGGRT